MTEQEVKAVLEASNDKDKGEWERARLVAYWSVVAVNGNKNMKNPSDLFKFPWEVKTKKKQAKTLTKEEFLKLADKVKNIQHGKKRAGSRG